MGTLGLWMSWLVGITLWCLELFVSSQGRLPAHADVDELESAGNAGLLRALRGYDPHSPVMFEAYAQVILRSSLLDALRAIDWAPRSLRRQQRELARAEEELMGLSSSPPTALELAEHLGWSRGQVVEVSLQVANAHHRSLDEMFAPHEERPATPEPPSSDLDLSPEVRESLTAFVEGLSLLPPISQVVLSLHYFEGVRLSAIADRLGLSEVRVSQAHARAVLAVRDTMREHYGLAPIHE